MKFREAINQQILAEHKMAVLDHLIKYISEYLPQEVGEKQTLVDKTCIQPEVSLDAFYSIMEDLCTFRELVKSGLEDTESVEVDLT